VLRHHPNVVGDIRERHYLDLVSLRENATQTEICQYKQQYFEKSFSDVVVPGVVAEKHLERQRSAITVIDKTPSYLRSFDTPRIAQQIFGGHQQQSSGGNAQIIAILRNPVDRLYSHYKMITSELNYTDSFDDFVHSQFDALDKLNLTRAPSLREYHRDKANRRYYTDRDFELPPRGSRNYKKESKRGKINIRSNALWIGMYAPQLTLWLRYFELGRDLHVAHFEALNARHYDGFEIISEAMGLPPFKYPKNLVDHYTNGHNSTAVGGGGGVRGGGGGNDKERGGGGGGGIGSMSDTTREYLQRFYKPYNDHLAQLLGEGWRGIWEDSSRQ